mgnify:FL=1
MTIVFCPKQGLLDPEFEYRNSASTDVTITWRKYGWRSLSEPAVSREYARGYAAGQADAQRPNTKGN